MGFTEQGRYELHKNNAEVCKCCNFSVISVLRGYGTHGLAQLGTVLFCAKSLGEDTIFNEIAFDVLVYIKNGGNLERMNIFCIFAGEYKNELK